MARKSFLHEARAVLRSPGVDLAGAEVAGNYFDVRFR
jgi:hypothetical protein